MDGNISKALWLGVSILLFIAVVTVGLTVFNGMKNASSEANNKIGSITQTMADEDFAPFDGKEVTGENVSSAIRNLTGKSGEVIVLVCTLGSNSGNELDIEPDGSLSINSPFIKYVSNTSIGSLSEVDGCWTISGGTGGVLFSEYSKNLQETMLRDAGDNTQTGKYINPAGKFKAYLIYDDNQVIKGIVCAQMD